MREPTQDSSSRGLLSRTFGVGHTLDEAHDSLISLGDGNDISLNPIKAYQDRNNGFAHVPNDILQPFEGLLNILLAGLRLITLPIRALFNWRLNQTHETGRNNTFMQMLGFDLLETTCRLVRGLALAAFSALTLIFIPFRLLRSAGRGLSNWINKTTALNTYDSVPDVAQGDGIEPIDEPHNEINEEKHSQMPSAQITPVAHALADEDNFVDGFMNDKSSELKLLAPAGSSPLFATKAEHAKQHREDDQKTLGNTP